MNAFAGTNSLIRLILRRDRISLLIWIGIVTLIPVALAASLSKLFSTPAELQTYVDANLSTPATIGMLGFIYSVTPGAVVAWRAGLNGAFIIVPVCILYIIRHTRVEEQSGRRELLGATAVGRYAPLTAALIVVGGATLVMAALITLGLIATGLPAAGSFIFALSGALTGWVFAALAGVLAQLTENPGPARGIAFAIFAVTWIMRAVGDLSGPLTQQSWLSWLSPLGWLRFTRAFAGEQWWVLLLTLALTAVLVVGAYALSARRDLGAGLLPARLGLASASPSLNSPLALAWRLNRGTLFAWAGGSAAFGFLLGTVGVSIAKFVEAPQLQDWVTRMGAQNAGDAFLFIVMYVLGQVISAYAIAAALRLRSEETSGRADPLLATPVSRLSWATSHLFFAVVGPTVLLIVMGLMIGLGYGLASGNMAADLPRMFTRTLVTLPAVWVMAGIATLFYGFLPRLATAVTWALFAVFLILELFWEVGQINQTIFNLSPFAHVHWALEVTAAPLISLTLIASALIAAGLVGLRRRDLV